MTTFDGPSGNDTDANLLGPEETFDEDEVGDFYDTSYSPAERPLFISDWGTTAREATGHEDLTHRLAREVRENTGDGDTDDVDGTAFEPDGEAVGDQIGDIRAGRLVSSDLDVYDSGSDFRAQDVGIDGGAASAEEAAIHIVPDE